jgi:putative OmpL-like beta-barrel porin-2
MRVVLRIAAAIIGLTFGSALPFVCSAQVDANQGAQQQVDPATTTDVAAQASGSSSTAQGQMTSVAMSAPEQQPAPASTSSTASSTPAPQDQTAQAPATPPAAPQPLPTPSMTAPLQTSAPQHTFSAGPFGTLAITGILSGMGMIQNNWVPGDKSTHWDLSNGQIFLQKTTGWWQFYLQGGAYNLPDLGTPFISTNKALPDFFGPLPVAFLKLVKGGFSVDIGELPTLIGAEYTFSFENLNIERGLLWNQENAVNRGIQLNESYKKFSASLSWNDGFYSNRYTWLTGSLAWAFNSANTLSFVAGGNAGQTKYSTVAAPVQNNSAIYEVIYTYSHGNWYVQPYYQYTNVPTNLQAGIPQGASTSGGALLFNYNFKHGISLALRPEYISSSGTLANGAVNLMYGPGSNAFAFTVTPTYQKDGFFARLDFSVVDARSFTAGDAFGPLGQNGKQTRGVVEAGFMF